MEFGSNYNFSVAINQKPRKSVPYLQSWQTYILYHFVFSSLNNAGACWLFQQ